MNIIQIISEELLNVNYKYIPIDFEYGSEDLEEIGLDIYEVAEQSDLIAKESNLNILRDKELSGLIIDLSTNEVAGALWITTDNDEISFDIAVSNKHRNKRLSYILIDNAMSEYNTRNDMYQDYQGEELPMKIDVINPILAKTLKNKYGFKIVNKITDNIVIMSK